VKKGERMAEKTDTNAKESQEQKVIYRNGAANVVYGLGMIGAWIFYIGTAPTFWLGVLGFLKGIVWPVFLILDALKFLHP
jgi:hypothetical protein